MTDSHIATLPTHSGPSRFGSHFLSTFWACPRKWSYSHIAPHPSGGIGLEENPKGAPLLIGLEVHAGLEARYRGNEPSTLSVAKAKHSEHVASGIYAPGKAEESWEVVEKLLTNYAHFYYGEQLKIPRDSAGKLMVEYNLEAALGYRDYIYTARVDMIVESDLGPGIFEVWDHKTVDAAGRAALCRQLDLSTQLTGALWLCSQQLPEMNIDTAVGNLLVKRAASTPPCERYVTLRDAEDLAQFRREAVSTLMQLDAALERYADLTASRMTPYEAICQSFRKQPSRECAWCEFAQMCKDPANAAKYAADLKARTNLQETPK